METKHITDNEVQNQRSFQRGQTSGEGGQAGEKFSQLLGTLLGAGAAKELYEPVPFLELAPTPQEPENSEQELLTEEAVIENEESTKQELEVSESSDESELAAREEGEEAETEATEAEDAECEELAEEAETDMEVEEVEESDLDDALVEEQSSADEQLVVSDKEVSSVVEEVAQTSQTKHEPDSEERVMTADTGTVVERRTEEVGQDSTGRNNPEERAQFTTNRDQDTSLPKELESQITEQSKQNTGRQQMSKTPAETASRVSEQTRVVESDEPVVIPNSVAPEITAKASNNQGAGRNDLVHARLMTVQAPAVGSEMSNGHQGGLSSWAQPFGNAFGINGKDSGSEKLESAKGSRFAKMFTRETRYQTIERVKELLKTAAQNRNGNTLVVRLDPPALGSLTMKVTHKAGQVFARIIPESGEVETVLRARVSELVHVLAATGLNSEDVHVSIGSERSETELYQFGDFLNRHNQGQKKDKSFSSESDEKENNPVVMTQGKSRELQDSGWVA